jgi:alanyl-tRNA synthetase
VYDQNRQVSQAFSAQILDTSEAARKMNDTLAAEKLRANTLQKQVFAYTAKQYEGRGHVLHFAEDLAPGQVRELADAIAGTVSGWAAVFSGEGSSYSYCLATRSGDLREMGKAMTQALSGRGGGKPNFQQGSVNATRQEIEAFFAHFIP